MNMSSKKPWSNIYLSYKKITEVFEPIVEWNQPSRVTLIVDNGSSHRNFTTP